MPARMKTIIVTLKTLMPETAAASAFPPTANIFLPNFVLFQMNHMIAIPIAAQMIMIGKSPLPSPLPETIAVTVGSGAPVKELPVIPAMIPNVKSCVASVEMNGCILNFAVKKPAVPEMRQQAKMERRNAKTTRTPKGKAVKLGDLPKNVIPVSPVVVTSIPVKTEAIPTRRPILKSVPAKTISPPTPKAKKIFGETWLRMRRMLSQLN